MDRSVSKKDADLAGLSVRNGPVEDEMDVDAPTVNGANKRKSRTSITKINYKDGSESDDGAPLVRDTRRNLLWGEKLADSGMTGKKAKAKQGCRVRLRR